MINVCTVQSDTYLQHFILQCQLFDYSTDDELQNFATQSLSFKIICIYNNNYYIYIYYMYISICILLVDSLTISIPDILHSLYIHVLV